MNQEHNNTITQNKLKQLKPRFGRVLRRKTERAYSQRKR